MQLKTLHSTSVVIEDAGVIIIGNSGSGKSDLALRLIDSGATLISDDVTLLKKMKNQFFCFLLGNQRIVGGKRDRYYDSSIY